MNAIIKQVEKESLSTNEMHFKPGDTVSVSLKIREGNKERVQAFQGTVIKIRGTGTGKTFTVRKSSGNVFVERVFPIHSSLISHIKVVRRGRVRRAKLYYLRHKRGKEARIKERK